MSLVWNLGIFLREGVLSVENTMNVAVFGVWISVWVICMYNSSTASTLLNGLFLSIHVTHIFIMTVLMLF